MKVREKKHSGQVTILGNARCGKSSILAALKGDKFDGACESTRGIEMEDVTIPNLEEINGALVINNESLAYEEPWEQVKINYYEDEEEENEEDKISDEEIANRLHISIWDFGGEAVLRQIQYLYLNRYCAYVVVFNVEDFFNDERKDTALEDLHYCLHALQLHTVSEDSSTKDESSPYPPVLLVGTHYDRIKENTTLSQDLQNIHQTIKSNFGNLNLFPTSSDDDDFKGYPFLYNTQQDICFWPISNSESQSPTIRNLRRLLIQACVQDKESLVNKPLPVAQWEGVLDEMAKISEEKQLLRVKPNKNPVIPNDYDDDDYIPKSVIELLEEHGALEDLDKNSSNYDDLCYEKAQTFLKHCNRTRSCLYVNHNNGFEDYCILDPSWLSDTVTYVIRDFKIHRSRRDRRAMDLGGSKPWRALMEKGNLSIPLMRKMWLGENENINYLLRLVIEIGLFAPMQFNLDDHLENGRGGLSYLVPGLRTVPFVDTLITRERVEEYVSSDEQAPCVSSFEFTFLPTGFFEQTVAKLVGGWGSAYNGFDDDSQPCVLPNGVTLFMGSKNIPFAMLLVIGSYKSVSSIELHTCSKKIMDLISIDIAEVLKDVNDKMYKGRLKFKKVS